MIREPVVAGQFYPASAARLKEMIASFVDKKAVKREAIGAVVPHAGYVYSGPVAGAVFSGIRFKDTIVLLGPNHTGQGKPFSIMTEGKWKTPLGKVETDTELALKILENSAELEADALAHEQARRGTVEVDVVDDGDVATAQPSGQHAGVTLDPGGSGHTVGRSRTRTAKQGLHPRHGASVTGVTREPPRPAGQVVLGRLGRGEPASSRRGPAGPSGARFPRLVLPLHGVSAV